MKAEENEAIVKDCKNSGMTIREYGEQKGIPAETLHTWIRRTRKRKGIRDDRKSYEEYRAIVIECKSSGKTAKEWCFKKGIKYGTYCNWSKKVNRKEGRENIDRLCGIAHAPDSREPEAKVTANPQLCEIRR